MNKQEILKQADYNFQRGNQKIAEKLLSDLLGKYPKDESAWMLMARVVTDTERKGECYKHVLKINPDNTEAKIGLARIQFPSKTKTLPRHILVNDKQFSVPSALNKTLWRVFIISGLILVFGTTTFVVAKTNPQSVVAQMILPATPTPFAETLADDIAAQTRAEVSAKYPQYSQLMEALISLAISNADNGMEGAPERPGAEIVVSDSAGAQARTTLENALPQPGSLNTVTLTEEQLTSWLAMEMRNSPDLPLQDVQVYLRNGSIQIWGVVTGSENSTSALVVGKTSIDANGNPNFELESLQIGQQVIPELLLSQAESWLDELVVSEIDRQVPGLEIMNINVSSGLITISGMR